MTENENHIDVTSLFTRRGAEVKFDSGGQEEMESQARLASLHSTSFLASWSRNQIGLTRLRGNRVLAAKVNEGGCN